MDVSYRRPDGTQQHRKQEYQKRKKMQRLQAHDAPSQLQAFFTTQNGHILAIQVKYFVLK